MSIDNLSNSETLRSSESRTASQSDLDTIENQLGRTPRDVHAISYRCPCGKPAVVETPPRLSNGEPFPTFYYATCPRLTAAISTLETTGMMESMSKRLETDAELAGAYAAATMITSLRVLRSRLMSLRSKIFLQVECQRA